MMKSFICDYCGTKKALTRNSAGKYCNNKCQQDHIYQKYIESWLEGKENGNICSSTTLQISNYVRRWLISEYGTACSKCGWDEKHPIDGKHLTEIDHIDGDASNTTPDNLRILCPNCHSMTPTFRSRNKKSKRKRKY